MAPSYIFAANKSTLAQTASDSRTSFIVPSQVQVSESGDHALPLYNISRVARRGGASNGTRSRMSFSSGSSTLSSSSSSSSTPSVIFQAQPYDDDDDTISHHILFSSDGISLKNGANLSSSQRDTRHRHSVSGSSRSDRLGNPLPRSGSTSALLSTFGIGRFSRSISTSNQPNNSEIEWKLVPTDVPTKFIVKCVDPELEIGKWVKRDNTWYFYHEHKPIAKLRLGSNTLTFSRYDEYLEAIDLVQYIRLIAKRANDKKTKSSHRHSITIPQELPRPSLTFFDAIAFLAISLRLATATEWVDEKQLGIVSLARCSETLMRTGKLSIPRMLGTIKHVIL